MGELNLVELTVMRLTALGPCVCLSDLQIVIRVRYIS